MCLRLNSLCGMPLKTAAIIAGIFTLFEALGLIVAGAYYLHQGLKANDFGPSGWDKLPYRFEYMQIFGALYLAFGVLWVLCLLIYTAALYVERPCYLIPWLVLQAITMGLGLANTISNGTIKDWYALGVVPLLLFFFLLYVVVFSYYLELQRQIIQYKKCNRNLDY